MAPRKNILPLLTVVLLLVPVALLGKRSRHYYQLRHAYCNSERPEFHELKTNGSMRFLPRVVSSKHNLLSMTFLVSAEIPVTNACAAFVLLIFSVEGFVIPCEKQLKCMLI